MWYVARRMKNLILVTARYWAKYIFCPGLTQPGVVVQGVECGRVVQVPDTRLYLGFVRRPSHVSTQRTCITILLPWRAATFYWLNVPHRLHKSDGLVCGKKCGSMHYTTTVLQASESNFFHFFSLPSLPPYHFSYLGNVLVGS